MNIGSDIQGFPTVFEAQEFVATHIGMVQYTLLFRDDSLWENGHYSLSNDPLPKNMSYSFFFNGSHNNDPRSKELGVNFPLLVLQKTLEESYLRVRWQDNFERYDVDYGQLWAASETFVSLTDDAANVNATACDMSLRNNQVQTLSSLLPWVLTFAFLLMSNISFQLIAEERRKKLFQNLRRLGLLDTAYWASWFVTFQILLVMGCALATFSSSLVIPHSAVLGAIDMGLMFMLLWLSGTAFVSLSCFLAAFCSSSSVATALSFTQFLIAIFTIVFCGVAVNHYAYAVTDDDSADPACLLINSSYNLIYSKALMGNTFVQFLVFFLPFFHASQAMSDIMSVVQYSAQTIGMDALNTETVILTTATTQGVTFHSKWISNSFLMMFYNTLLFMYLAWLSAQLVSSDDTEGRPLLSVIFPTFIRKMIAGESNEVIQDGDVRGAEKAQSRADQSVRAYKVSKTYSGVQALKEVSFEMKKGEVFVLLGHNGAGKSTLMNIITGLIQPTHGKVYLSGLDVEAESAQVQQTIGVCAQDDLLWDDLTAREHMLLTAAFKGLEYGTQLFQAVDSVLAMVQLEERADHFARQYSGGMKRRLSVAMSTVGDVEILFLDEPTTGLDPVSRRHVWDAINFMKKDRVVVLTTHNMEEADYLADTIMIMHSGQVRAFGDPLFLKQAYGKGYQVNLVVKPTDLEEAQQLVTQALPSSQLVVNLTTGGISVTVPRGDLRGLPRLFTWLESSARAHAIVKEWGVTNTTLEQVFLMLCVQNTDVNFSTANAQEEQVHRQRMCPMCQVFMKETVFMRNFGGKMMILPDSLCNACATSNPHFCVEDATALSIQASEGSHRVEGMAALLAAAQTKMEAAATKRLLDAESAHVEEFDRHLKELTEEGHALGAPHCAADEPSDMAGAKDSSIAIPAPADATVPAAVPAQGPGGGSHQVPINFPICIEDPYSRTAHGSFLSQIHALWVKNAQLQYRQRCSNCCR